MKKAYLIDTNFILRLLLGDIPPQLIKAERLFKKIEEKKAIGWVSLLVFNELIWILENFYEKKRSEFIPLVLRLISLKNIKVVEIKKSELVLILKAMERTRLDFTDLYLSSLAQKSQHNLASFDRKLLKTVGKQAAS